MGFIRKTRKILKDDLLDKRKALTKGPATNLQQKTKEQWGQYTTFAYFFSIPVELTVDKRVTCESPFLLFIIVPFRIYRLPPLLASSPLLPATLGRAVGERGLLEGGDEKVLIGSFSTSLNTRKRSYIIVWREKEREKRNSQAR